MYDLFEIPGQSYMQQYVKERIAKGYLLRVIRSKPKEVSETWPTSATERRELRYAPNDMVFENTTYIYDDKVTLISTSKENFGMIIESREYAQTMRNLFEALWITSEPD